MKTIWLIYVLIPVAYSAPRSRTKNLPQTVYDQKQTGDYNIQLHLKDFQIIALLSDESLGGLGDYDYNYDYADLTVKPIATNVTLKPVENETTTLKPKPEETSSGVSHETSTPSTTSSSSRPDKVDV